MMGRGRGDVHGSRFLLERSHKSPCARSAPSPRQPKKAHDAIPVLAKSGHVRVILTTNVDRLLQRSLEAVGVCPVVD